MSRRLAGFVHVHTEAGPVVFGPDDDVPDWAVEQITNPKAWAVEDAPEPAAPKRTRAAKADEAG